MNVILIAPPAAGKGTQAEMLREEYNLYHLSTGDVLREIANSNTEIGKEVKEIIDSGNLISDDLMLEILKEKINSLENNNGIIFDGFPRTINQAEMLSNLLSSMNQQIDYVIYLDIEKEEAMKRSTGRITCSKCKKIYNIYFDSFNEQNKCNECGNMLEKREDDTEEKFNHRFETYIKNTRPVIDYYNAKGYLKVVKSTGSKYEIYERVKSIIEKGNNL